MAPQFPRIFLQFSRNPPPPPPRHALAHARVPGFVPPPCWAPGRPVSRPVLQGGGTARRSGAVGRAGARSWKPVENNQNQAVAGTVGGRLGQKSGWEQNRAVAKTVGGRLGRKTEWAQNQVVAKTVGGRLGRNAPSVSSITPAKRRPAFEAS